MPIVDPDRTTIGLNCDEERGWIISSALMVLTDAQRACSGFPTKGTTAWCEAVGQDDRDAHVVASAWDVSLATVYRHRAEHGDR
jgi:hypothetical protein